MHLLWHQLMHFISRRSCKRGSMSTRTKMRISAMPSPWCILTTWVTHGNGIQKSLILIAMFASDQTHLPDRWRVPIGRWWKAHTQGGHQGVVQEVLPPHRGRLPRGQQECRVCKFKSWKCHWHIICLSYLFFRRRTVPSQWWLLLISHSSLRHGTPLWWSPSTLRLPGWWTGPPQRTRTSSRPTRGPPCRGWRTRSINGKKWRKTTHIFH